MKTTWTFTTAYAYAGDGIYLSCAADIYEDFARFTNLYKWDPQLQEQLGDSQPWFYKSVDWRACSVTALIPERDDAWWLCALSEDGEVAYSGSGNLPEQIPDAGVRSPQSFGYGYLSDLQQIGDHLYAAGFSGQVYRRAGPNQWAHMDQGILQAPGMRRGHYSISVINGPNEEAIYVGGCIHEDGYPVRASYWNGNVWRDLKLPDSAERITNMYVESDTRIWMCGANGTLLLGNAQDGFQNLSGVDDNQLFLSVCKFEEKIYLGSNLGLFVYKPYAHDEGIQRVLTHMQPELQDANIVDAVDGVLWSIGPKDIARFDGHRWERIHHPDNPPIGGSAPTP